MSYFIANSLKENNIIMEIEESLTNEINKLNYNWFLKVKENFEKEGLYDPKRNRINDTLTDYELNPKTDEDEPIDITIDISLESYCWFNNVPSSSFPILENDNLIYAEVVANNCLYLIQSCLNGIDEIKAIHKFILNVIEIISSEIEFLINESQKFGNDESAYELTLEYFFKKFKALLSENYGHIKRIYLITNDYKNVLKFDLNQEQLAALIYLLDKCDFLYKPKPDNTSFINFCQEYFQFNNQLLKDHTSAKGLRNKFNELKNDEIPHPALEYVTEIIQKAIQNISQ